MELKLRSFEHRLVFSQSTAGTSNSEADDDGRNQLLNPLYILTSPLLHCNLSSFTFQFNLFSLSLLLIDD